MKQPNQGAWTWVADGDDFTWHEIPVNDLIEHDISTDCICGPTVFPDSADGTVIIAHPSLDGRESDWHSNPDL